MECFWIPLAKLISVRAPHLAKTTNFSKMLTRFPRVENAANPRDYRGKSGFLILFG